MFFSGRQSAVAVIAQDVTQRFKVVGVIADSMPNQSVAVIKDQQDGKTTSLRIGMSLPNNTAFKVQGIEHRLVTVSDGNQSFVLDYGQTAIEEPKEEDVAQGADSVDKELDEGVARALFEQSPLAAYLEQLRENGEDSQDLSALYETLLGSKVVNLLQNENAEESSSVNEDWLSVESSEASDF
jgi:hypothetical protein